MTGQIYLQDKKACFRQPLCFSNDILLQSKKIHKLKYDDFFYVKAQVKAEEPYESKLLLKTGYDTFLPGEREKILNAIKNRILKVENLNLRLEENSLANLEIDWAQHIKELNFRDLNDAILEVIPSYKPYLSLDHQKLTQLRKKIKNWFKSQGKVETRGAPLILDSELPKFLDAAKSVLLAMKYRSFEELRSKMIPIIEKIHQESARSFRSKSIFSKHFWCDFSNKHTEIGELWKNLPRSKPKKSTENASPSSEGELISISNDILLKIESELARRSQEDPVKMEEAG